MEQVRKEAEAWKALCDEKKHEGTVDVDANVRRTEAVLDLWRSRYPGDIALRETEAAKLQDRIRKQVERRKE